MGLDMYLEARKYVGKIDWSKVPKRGPNDDTPINFNDYPTDDYLTLKSMFPEDLLKHNESGSSIGINVGYWRKANQIHGWFVENVQGGEDNCQPYPVEREKLVELLETIIKVRAEDKETAKELLPVVGGFFFGNYDEDEGYDEWYYMQLEYTEKMLTDILAAVPEGTYEYDFIYQSSW